MTARPPIDIDESLVALSRELRGLSDVHVPRAAKERGWAALQAELERRPVKARFAAPAGRKTGTAAAAGGIGALAYRFRYAAGAAAVMLIAVVAVVLALYGGGPAQTAETDPVTGTSVVSSDPSDPTQPVTTVRTLPVTSNSTLPESTDPAGGPSPGQPGGDEPGGAPDATQPGGTDTPGGSTVPTSGGPVTTGGSTGTTPTTTAPAPPTTQPQRTTTTAEALNAAAQREGSAKSAAAYLAHAILFHDLSGARGVVAASAQTSLAQMMLSLEEPFGYKVTGATSLSGDTVRVALAFDDRVLTPNGEVTDVVKTFFVRVRVNDDGAVITAINAGS